ncbi:MAG: hypothetical protein WC627_03735 [Legionella sp.]|jgi:hypothetical protein
MNTAFNELTNLITLQKDKITHLTADNAENTALLNELRQLTEKRSTEVTLINQINELIREANVSLDTKNKIELVAPFELNELSSLFFNVDLAEKNKAINKVLNHFLVMKQYAEEDNNTYKKVVLLLKTIKDIYADYQEIAPDSRLKYRSPEEAVNHAIADSGLNTHASKTHRQYLEDLVYLAKSDDKALLLPKIDEKLASLEKNIIPKTVALSETQHEKISALSNLHVKLNELYAQFIKINDNPKLEQLRSHKQEVVQKIETQVADIKNLTETSQEMETCMNLLMDIEATKLRKTDVKDLVMEQYIAQKIAEITANKDNLKELQAISARLTIVSKSLQDTSQIESVLKVTRNLQSRNAWYTVGVQTKVKRIVDALYSLPIEERGMVLSSKKTNAVKLALAAKRPVFFGDIVEAKTDTKGTIIKDKAAKSYKEAMSSIRPVLIK